MLYRDFGRTGWKVSAIGMGTWNIGNQWGQIDDATSWATVRAAYDSGMNLFDTAESYGLPNGLSEERLGVALAGIRHDVYVVSKVGNWGKRTGQGVPMHAAALDQLQQPFDVLINAISAGLHGDMPALDPKLVAPGSVAYDMVYGAEPTPFMRWAERLEAAAVCDGLGMLVEQAAEAFQVWRGWRPDTAPVLAGLRGA
jgi:hypothetical protein